MGAPWQVICPGCRIPFTRHGAPRSTSFNRTEEENETCIVCREGLDPVTLERPADRGETMKAETFTDIELIEVLEMGATRLRLAGVDELRLVATHMGDVAAAAADRLRRRRRRRPRARARRERFSSETRGRCITDCPFAATPAPVVVDAAPVPEWIRELDDLDEAELERRDREADSRWAAASKPKRGNHGG